jgi:hypothetical protein
MKFTPRELAVTRGLLETVGSENELVFILAHEMGHFAHLGKMVRGQGVGDGPHRPLPDAIRALPPGR